MPAVAVTFDPHPVAVLRPEHAPAPLTTHDRRAALLRAGGADAVVRLPVDRHLLAHTAGEFFERVLLGAFGAVGVVEGGDFRFGRDRGRRRVHPASLGPGRTGGRWKPWGRSRRAANRSLHPASAR